MKEAKQTTLIDQAAEASRRLLAGLECDQGELAEEGRAAVAAVVAAGRRVLAELADSEKRRTS